MSSAEAAPAAKVTDTRPSVKALSAKQAASLQALVDQQLATTRGGTQVSANEVSYDNGTVIMTFPLPGERTAPTSSDAAVKGLSADAEPAEGAAALASVDWHGCPSSLLGGDWYCFYEHENFGGRRLQWQDPHCSAAINFGDFGFRDQATGWVNTTSNRIIGVQDDLGNGNWVNLWDEDYRTMVANVGPSLNDRADRFFAC
ncbi:hypothetical protein [Kitasatospora fiedleri]|uniref:hypothetical protein n=1 Tax=Kitasatospora fiedleri TaxID=2991545 RepID=UPI00249C7F63|nr:hypothetical protein [Kitasatospora fiedleri]